MFQDVTDVIVVRLPARMSMVEASGRLMPSRSRIVLAESARKSKGGGHKSI
jgi:hypothetical protein